MLSEKLGKVLDHAKLKHGVKTQGQFALSVGIPLDRIKNILADRAKKISIDEMRKIEALYGVRATWWTNGKAPMLLESDERSVLDLAHQYHGSTEEVAGLDLEDWQTRLVGELIFNVKRKDADAVRRQIQNMIARSSAGALMIPVPIYADIRPSAGRGNGGPDQEIASAQASFTSEFMRQNFGRSGDDFAMTSVRGDSMQPSLYDGDPIIMDMRNRVVDRDGVYVFNLKGDIKVKRFQRRLDGSLLVKSDNPAYETQIIGIDDADDFTVIGRLVWPRLK